MSKNSSAKRRRAPLQTRILIEYFKPRPDEPAAFPLGLIIQDDRQVFYWLLRRPGFRREKFPEYALDRRAEIMESNILGPSYRSRAGGEFIPPTSPEFLNRLAEDALGNFRYGRIWLIKDFSADRVRAALTDAASEDHLLEVLLAREQPASADLRELERQIG